MSDFLLNNGLLIVLVPIFLIALIIIIWMISTVNGFMRFEDIFYQHKKNVFVSIQERHHWLKHMDESYQIIDSIPYIAWEDKPTCHDILEYAKSLEELIQKWLSSPQIKNISETDQKHVYESLLEIEEHIQFAKRKLNSDVSYYNQRISTFPTKIIASLRHYEKKPLIDLETIKWLKP